jgi:hypothetical protein
MSKRGCMKYIKIERCIDCPWCYADAYSSLCTKDISIVFSHDICKETNRDCPLKDYPETISDYLGGEI